ncbi:unnamed protein product, partial [Arabidopsis halleri]
VEVVVVVLTGLGFVEEDECVLRIGFGSGPIKGDLDWASGDDSGVERTGGVTGSGADDCGWNVTGDGSG